MRPRWMTVTGVLGIIFGGFGLMSAGQVLMMPTVLELQQKMLTALKEGTAAEPATEPAAQAFVGFFEGFMAPPPAWFVPWSIALGILGLVIAGVYVFGGVWLLLMKPSAPRIFCWALVASLALAAVRCTMLVLSHGIFGVMMAANGAFGIVIDLVLLIAVLSHRREWAALTAPPPNPAI